MVRLNRATCGGALALAVSALAASGELPRWEARLFRAVNGTPDWVATACWAPMQLGAGASPAVLGAALALRPGTRPLALRVAVAGGSAWLAAKGAKRLIGRGRPSAHLPAVVVRPGGTAKGEGYVSGHAAVAASLAACLWPRLSPAERVLAAAAVKVVGFARMQNGSHLPLDVVGGAGLGALLGGLARPG